MDFGLCIPSSIGTTHSFGSGPKIESTKC